MKTIISVLVGLVIFYLIFFQLDPWIVNSIMNAIPQEESIIEWMKLLKIAVWFFVISLTAGLGIGLSVWIGGIARIILDEIK